MTEKNPSSRYASLGERLLPWISWKRKRFWLSALIVLYALIGFFAVPKIIQALAIGKIEELGHSASIERVRVNPFLLTILVEGVEIREPDTTLILSYDAYFWDFELSSLFHWAWTFRKIRLDRLYINEERFAELDSRFSRLLKAVTAEAPAQETQQEDALPRIIIHALDINSASFTISDHTAGDFKADFGPININVKDLRTLPDQKGKQIVSITTSTGGLIEWSGDLRFQPFSSRGQLKMQGDAAADAFRYANHHLPFNLSGGALTLAFDYNFSLAGDDLEASVDNLQIGLDDLHIQPNDSDQDVISINGIRLDGGALHWPRQSVNLGALSLTGLEIHSSLDPEGHLNLLDLEPQTGAGPEPGTKGDALPWVLELAELSVTESIVHFQDQQLSPAAEVSLHDLQISLSGLDNQAHTRIPARLSYTLSSGGEFQFDGGITALPDVSIDGNMQLAGLALPVAQPYMAEYARVDLQAGLLNMRGTVSHGPQQPSRFTGGLEITGFDLTDLIKGERLAGWKSLQIDQLDLDLANQSLQTSELVFDELYGRLHIANDGSTNISDLIIVQDASEPSSTSFSNFVIGGVLLENASLDFSDLSLPLPFQAEIRGMGGEVSTLANTSAAPARVSMEGQVNEFGLARINGSLNAWDLTSQADITITFRNLDMSRLTPYTIQFAGYAIEDGRLDLDLQYLLENRQLQGANDIVMRELVLGDKVDHPDAGSLPLGLAVALLTDSEGKISIDLPVSGDLDDPEFKIGGIVWQALGNLITKAVTAPFKLLGSLVGIDSEDFGVMEFPAGQSDLLPPDREKLVKLGEAMAQRPDLALEIHGVYSPVPDRAALQLASVEAEIELRTDALPPDPGAMTTERERAVIEAMYMERHPEATLEAQQAAFMMAPEGSEENADPELDALAYVEHLRQQLIAARDISDQELWNLAVARADAVASALQAAHADKSLGLHTGDPVQVEPGDNDTVPLELQVSAGE